MRGYFTCCAVIMVLFACALPILLSHILDGWITKYTSPAPFFFNDMPNLSGRVAIVTGGNSGIGFVTARELTRKGADVIISTRSKVKGEKAVAEIKAAVAKDVDQPKIRYMEMDLSSLASVESFATGFLDLGMPLHLLILNAGVMKSPGAVFLGRDLTYGFELTKDGFEQHIGVNHIAHFHLTTLLLDKIKTSRSSRVVSVSSTTEQAAYDGGMRFDLWRTKGSDYEDGKAYGQSKLANIFFARELAHRLEGTDATAYSCHPGVIATNLVRHMNPIMEAEAQEKGAVAVAMNWVVGVLYDMAILSADDGALTQLYLATSVELPVNGGFYHPIAKLEEPKHKEGGNMELQKLLWVKTEELIAAVKSAKP